MKKKTMREHMGSRVSYNNNLSLFPPAPRSLNIELNNTCNHRCLYCQFHGPYALHKPTPAVMDPEFAKQIIRNASDFGAGTHELGLYMSGEPFLYPGLDEIIRYAKGYGFPYVYLTTNGALATPEKMKSVLDSGLDSIRFSINGADRAQYEFFHGRDDFDAAKNNLKFMSSYISDNNLKVSTSISVVVTKMTPSLRKDIIEGFGELVDDIVFFPVLLEGLCLDDDMRNKLIEVEMPEKPIDGFICSYPFNSMYIDALGRVKPCCNNLDDNVGIWDLTKECDLRKAWNSELMIRYRRIFIEGASVKGTACEKCHLRFKPDFFEGDE